LRVEFHRRTGVLERVIDLVKVNGYLQEEEKKHPEEERQRQPRKDWE
jgi:hypothetical protein